MGCHFLLQGKLPDLGIEPVQILYYLSDQGSPLARRKYLWEGGVDGGRDGRSERWNEGWREDQREGGMNGSYPGPPKIKGYRPPSQACPVLQPTPRLQRSPATAWPVPMAEPLTSLVTRDSAQG